MSEQIKAVAYYRMSTDKQEDSIDSQRTEVEKYAANNNYKIIRPYIDAGISGTKSEERKQFQQLIADAERKEFQVILCWDQDRFGRFDTIESGYWIHPLRKNGIRLVTVAHGEIDWNTFQGRMIFNIQQEGKHQHVLDIRRNTKRALQKLKSEGKWVDCIPLGYKTEGQKYDRWLVLGDPSDMALVKRIFDLHVKGYGVTYIANKLNSEGVPSRRNKQWSPSGLTAILNNPTYVGDRIATDGATLRDVLPTIIDRATWDAVQRMPITKRRARGHGECAPLSGLLVCGRCGEPMYAKTNRNWQTYLCSSYTHGGKCGHCAIRRDPIMKAVAAKLREHVLMGSRDRLEALIQRELDRQRAPSVDPMATEKKLAALDRQIERAAGRILSVDDSLVADLEKQLLALKQNRNALAATVEPQRAPCKRSARMIASKLWELDRILADGSPTAVRRVLSQRIDHIRLDFRETAGANQRRRYEFTGGVMRLLPQRKTSARSF